MNRVVIFAVEFKTDVFEVLLRRVFDFVNVTRFNDQYVRICLQCGFYGATYLVLQAQFTQYLASLDAITQSLQHTE